jgi:hypothetical protein
MGMFSMCNRCGSDWCSRCECLADDLRKAQKQVADKFIADNHLLYIYKELCEILRDQMLAEIDKVAK